MQVIINVRRAVLLVMLGLCGAAPAVAQTCQRSPVGGGTIGVGFALTAVDDGAGPALYGGGYDVTAHD